MAQYPSEPARIDRECTLPPGIPGTQVFGAGREDRTLVVFGNSVELHCPATGIGDPSTSWRRITRNGRGRPREVRINNPRFTFRYVNMFAVHHKNAYITVLYVNLYGSGNSLY